ncbi:hypothetical protein [Motilimonas pumila]|uniref:GerMN domain-containing protein n=1 Tax=Motilimonas pumila TaxID=2303987 RepID=A0A418Y9P6_9GAMM|nr:hypothetical protein [Motilimonas pumila]RJG38161.1 hypothetical protein D1Z90_19230 [Motilimonas pumila]
MTWLISFCGLIVLVFVLLTTGNWAQSTSDADVEVANTPQTDVPQSDSKTGLKTNDSPPEEALLTSRIQEAEIGDDAVIVEPIKTPVSRSIDEGKTSEVSVYDTFNQEHEAVAPVFLSLIKDYGDGRFYRAFANYTAQDKPDESSELLEQQVENLIAQAPNQTSIYTVDCRVEYCIATFTLDSGTPREFLSSFGGKNISPWQAMEVVFFVTDQPTNEAVIFFSASQRHLIRGYAPVMFVGLNVSAPTKWS